MSTPTPTPETDKACVTTDYLTGEPVVPTDFARSLERRLIESQAACAAMRAALEKWQHVWKETECEEDDCASASRMADAALQPTAGAELLAEVERLRKLVSAPIERGSRLEWTFNSAMRRWNGTLKGHPDRTLFILNLCEDRDDRCHLLGGVMSDGEDREHTRVLVTWAKFAAEMYLDAFEDLLTGGIAARLTAERELADRLGEALDSVEFEDYTPDFALKALAEWREARK